MRSWRYVLAWWCVFAAVMPGDFGTVDTARRLQVAHAWWTGEPEVPPADQASFGIPACRGVVRAWYGAGQSALMLPADIAASAVTSDPRRRALLVDFLVFPTLAVATLVAAEALLVLLGSRPGEARIATALFAVSTTFLPYVQINQENSLLLFLLVAGAAAAIEHARSGSVPSILAVGAAAGGAVLTRVPALADALLLLAFAVILRARRAGEGTGLAWRAVVRSAAIAAACFTMAVVIERVYQHARFCNWTGTYYSAFGAVLRSRDLTLASTFPYTTPFGTGVAGFLWSPSYAIVLADPVIILAVALLWTRRSRADRWLSVLALTLLAATIVGYARYYNWWGGSSWGSRYTTVPIDLLCLLGLGAAVRAWPEWSRVRRVAAGAVVTAGLIVNALALVFWYELELEQQGAGVSTKPILVQRGINVVALLTNRWEPWGLLPSSISKRMASPNVLAWLAQPYAGRYGGAILAVWVVVLAWSAIEVVRGVRAEVAARRRP